MFEHIWICVGMCAEYVWICVCLVYREPFGIVCVSPYGVPVCELYVCEYVPVRVSACTQLSPCEVRSVPSALPLCRTQEAGGGNCQWGVCCTVWPSISADLLAVPGALLSLPARVSLPGVPGKIITSQHLRADKIKNFI